MNVTTRFPGPIRNLRLRQWVGFLLQGGAKIGYLPAVIFARSYGKKVFTVGQNSITRFPGPIRNLRLRQWAGFLLQGGAKIGYLPVVIFARSYGKKFLQQAKKA